MPEHLRNFWLVLQACDGLQYETGQRMLEVGTVQACQFKLRIYEKEHGEIRDVYEITGRCADEGNLTVEIKDAHGQVVCSHETSR